MSEKRLRGRAWVGGVVRDDVEIVIRGRTITDVLVHSSVAHPSSTAPLIVPGFIDVHVHGGNGRDFMDGDDAAAREVTRCHARNGTTTMAATTLSASRADLAKAVRAIERVASGSDNPQGAEIAGIHLEGPYISAAKAGAQDRRSIRPPDVEEISALLALAPSLRWIMTIAPEIDGAIPLLEFFRERILFSIGHTAATYAQAVQAMEFGATHFTHLFNAMTPMHHRDPGVVGAALVSTSATVELIADGIHVHPVMLRLVAGILPERVALVTDAMRACCMPEGSYKLYDHDVTVKDGAARLADGTLAGSVLTMSRAVQNMVELAGEPLDRALAFATTIPARLLGVESRKGKIEPGFDADLVVLTPRFGIDRVFVRGTEIDAA